ncbi:hypothetical protein ABT324_08835 [Saccharopolyspora sp. NPDC000359]|uniref:hypothetical protein n=1 Tax=Saccharopolyspora sp. NPDC000359 TaxID=3154251 RepID=UPI00332B17FF
MLEQQWTDYDELVLDAMGIDSTGLVLCNTPAARSEWEPERLLQAAADGELHVYGVTEDWSVVRLWIDGRPITVDEQEYVIDMLGDFLVFIGTRVALTAHGREILAYWTRVNKLDRGEQG